MTLKYVFRLSHRQIIDLWEAFEFATEHGYNKDSLRDLYDILNDSISVLENEEF